jgi:hypothetical protein
MSRDYDLMLHNGDIRKLNKIMRKSCIQGPTHKDNISLIIRLLKIVMIEEFTEDNIPTLNEFFSECVAETNHNMYLRYSNHPIRNNKS